MVYRRGREIEYPEGTNNKIVRQSVIMENVKAPNENTRLYVIGDIHGRLDLLDRLIDEIDRDAKGQEANSLTVTLGDYIDRGPDFARCARSTDWSPISRRLHCPQRKSRGNITGLP